MQETTPPTLDMAPDGSFREVPNWQELPTNPEMLVGASWRGIGWRSRLIIAALGVSFVTGLIAVVAISFYIVLISLPVVLALALFGWLRRGQR